MLIGGGTGFIVFSKLIGLLLEIAPLFVCFFFVGAVLGGLPMVVKQANLKKFNFIDLLMTVVGIVIVCVISAIPSGIFSIDGLGGIGGVAVKILCGVILAFGFVLPGISFSQMLYVFGMYGEIVERVSNFDIFPLIPFGIGGIIGVFATSMLVEMLLKKYPSRVYMVICGFLIGSIPTLLKGQSLDGVPVWSYAVFAVLVVMGFAAVYAMTMIEDKKGK